MNNFKFFSKLIRKFKAMSLVEVMVGLIVLSAISAAFSPVIINRIKNDVNVSVIEEVTSNCNSIKLSSDCKLCDKTKNVCLDCRKECQEGYGLEQKLCKCVPCKPHVIECNPDTDKAIRCEAGYCLKDGECVEASPGQKCPDGQDPQACEPGTYGKGTARRDECPDCEKGYMCPDPDMSDNVGPTDHTPCPAGTYQDKVRQVSCPNVCPEDHYCPPATGDTDPDFKCPIGKCTRNETGKKSLSDCKDCPCNSVCPPRYCEKGEYWDVENEEITDCPAGTYQDEGPQYCQTACKKCGKGTYNNDTGLTICTNCSKGRFQNLEGQTACKPCTAGNCSGCNVVGKKTDGTACNAGTYCTAGQSVCSSCTAGHCKGCNIKGKTANGTACNKGTYCTEGKTACTNCSKGQYQDKTGQATCIPCTAGHCDGCNVQGRTSNGAICAVGKYCTAGSQTCSCCDAGKYSSTKGASSCKTCEPGYKCPGCSKRVACVCGTICNKSGCTICSNCPAGKDSAAHATACRTCAKGFKCPGGGSCRIGCNSSIGGGGYQPNEGQSTCKKCTVAANSHVCASDGKCPSPYSGKAGHCCTPATGNWSSYVSCGSCRCSAGQVYDSSQGKCIATPSGHYSATCTATSPGTKCSAGHCKGCSATGRKANGDLCDAGRYCLAGGAGCSNCSAGHCKGCNITGRTVDGSACAAGTYCTAGQTACSSCTAGHCKGCNIKGKTANGTACGKGTYCTAGKTSCTNCSAGHAVGCNVTGKTSNGTCCPSGKWSASGASVCSNCPAGYKCVKTDDTTCAKTACSAGTYSAEGSSSCANCPAGSKCPGSANKTCCAAGTYSDAKATACSTCTAGYKCVGCKNRTACNGGYYQNATGQSVCKKCAAGTYSTASGAKKSCTKCAAGTYSAAGATACTKCPAGYYCPNGIDKIPCNSGKYQNELGKSSCKDCECGTQTAATGAHKSCTACPSGQYSAVGTVCKAVSQGYGVSANHCKQIICPYPGGCHKCNCTGNTKDTCTCTTLYQGYFWETKEGVKKIARCREGTVYVKDMQKCVMAHNIGDDLTNFAWNKAATGVDHGNGISVSNKSKYCWENKAAGSRTVCTWYATNAICAYFGGTIVNGGWHEKYIMSNSSVASALNYCTNSSCPPTQNCPTYQNNYADGNAPISDSSSKKNYCYPGYYHTENFYEHHDEHSRHRRFDKIAQNQPDGGSDTKVPKSGRCALNSIRLAW